MCEFDFFKYKCRLVVMLKNSNCRSEGGVEDKIRIYLERHDCRLGYEWKELLRLEVLREYKEYLLCEWGKVLR